MSLIKGAVLIADPERMSFSDVLNLGTATASDYGLCHLADDIYKNLCEPPGPTTDVAKYYSSVATQVCNTGDVVCDTSSVYEKSDGFFRVQSPLTYYRDFKRGKSIHTSSYTASELESAGRGIALNLIQDGLGAAGSPPDPSSKSPSTPASVSTTPTSPTTTPPSTSSADTGSDSWTAAEAPLAGGSGSEEPYLGPITCPGAADCVALGSYYDSSGSQHVVLLTGSGTSWSVTDTPEPANNEVTPYGPGLFAVSCPAVSTCVAVGAYYDSAGNEQALIVTLSGTTWTATEAPLPAGAQPSGSRGAYLNSVACSSATACVAVGNYFDASGDQQGFIVTGSGTSWTATRAPLPANANANPSVSLTSIACAGASCGVVGNYTDASGDNQGLLLTGSGTTWTATEAPLPADASIGDPAVALNSVTCPSASGCVVVGRYDTSATDDQPALILTGWGSSWTAIESPVPSNSATQQGTDLSTVTCASATACVAAGVYTDTSVNEYAFLVTGSGSSWTAAMAPLPSNAGAIDTGGGGDADQILGVACASTATCYGVGTYWDGSTDWDAAILSGPA